MGWRSTGPAAMRTFGFPKAADPPISSFPNDTQLKLHSDHSIAKSGDVDAALRLVRALTNPSTVAEAGRRFGSGVIYVPVIAQEASGRNKLPEVLAHTYALSTGALVCDDIVQSTCAYHTGARPVERLISRPLFDGAVEHGRRYVLVDDVSVMGGTLAELANHVISGGGVVVGTVMLVNASRTRVLSAKDELLKKVDVRHGEIVREQFGIEPAALTASEARYLLNFKNADQLGVAIAKAGSERNKRLLAKGIGAPEV